MSYKIWLQRRTRHGIRNIIAQVHKTVLINDARRCESGSYHAYELRNIEPVAESVREKNPSTQELKAAVYIERFPL